MENPMSEIERIRNEIDGLDEKVASLLERRMKWAVEIGKVKEKYGLPVKYNGREDEVLARVRNGRTYGEYIERVYRYIMNVSKELQKNLD